MRIDRKALVQRHNPCYQEVKPKAPLSVGNGNLAFTVDITGLQSLYSLHQEADCPLCTMSTWGWHQEPQNKAEERDKLRLTAYKYKDREVYYPVEIPVGQEQLYHWLRQNPHRLNLCRLAFFWDGKELSSDLLSEVQQELLLFQGRIESYFTIHGYRCKVETLCAPEEDVLAFRISSEALSQGRLQVRLLFPYGDSGISASNWNKEAAHQTTLLSLSLQECKLKRQLDRNRYFAALHWSSAGRFSQESAHTFSLGCSRDQLEFTLELSPEDRNLSTGVNSFQQIAHQSENHWQQFWEMGGAIDFSLSTDSRSRELERRTVLSQYLLAIQCCGSEPPQETGLTCNSWYGKFHLEMHPWHSAWLPLWGRGHLLEKSLGWYVKHLPEAEANAAANGFKGARWPKMTGPEALDSPSPIAPLLIWQQPHLIYLLHLLDGSEPDKQYIIKYWRLIEKTADFMADFAAKLPGGNQYQLLPPLIPVQEEHRPEISLNPTFEVEYWFFTLDLAARWGQKLGRGDWQKWFFVSQAMVPSPREGELYLAHQNCPDTFTGFNRDHPSMLMTKGFICSPRIRDEYLGQTLDMVLEAWDFDSLWGWDFAVMSMTALRLNRPKQGLDILLMESAKNFYDTNGHNRQRKRRDLPQYLPGNGSLLLALAMMTAGFRGQKNPLPGFMKVEGWQVVYEDINPLPF